MEITLLGRKDKAFLASFRNINNPWHWAEENSNSTFFFNFFSFVQQTMPSPLFNLCFLYLKKRGINDCKNILPILYGFFFLESTLAIKVDATYAENFGELHNLEELQSSNCRGCHLKGKALQQCSHETIYIFMFRVSCGKCSSWHEDLLLDTAIKQSWNCS